VSVAYLTFIMMFGLVDPESLMYRNLANGLWTAFGFSFLLALLIYLAETLMTK